MLCVLVVCRGAQLGWLCLVCSARWCAWEASYVVGCCNVVAILSMADMVLSWRTTVHHDKTTKPLSLKPEQNV